MGKIRIYTNESVSVAIAEGLKRRGVDAFSARDTGNLGLTDEEQLSYAGKEKATILTHDTDFLQIAARWRRARLITGSYTAAKVAIRSANTFENSEC
ncbi:MAG: DUF5615 family PIN-like protein [Candidatus Tectomicrobia bacterium]|uniref:DUF5615 family PIN-like protein n=1 Tax=Tectimicrobiota bacterium TaxID=2528274 RepID=A0A933GLV5_UNCTE|nr:DUF5615 family PIN-like protein [Candidatus Tectomicrobia bacterium]